MKEILCRGRTVSESEYLDDGEWIEGFYTCFNGEEHRIYTGYAETDCGDYYPDWFDVIPETVGRYTGLTDKNGKKIFEDDILKIAKLSDSTGTYYYPPLPYPVNVVVKWDMCAWMWETLCKDKRYITFPNAWCHYECEVIGNIHDNPELMKTQD